MNQDKLWLLKQKNGRIQGPLSEDEIIHLIKDKTVCGEETIAVYPGGRWKSISVEPCFYEHLLQALSYVDDVDEKVSHFTAASQSSCLDESQQSATSETVVANLDELKSLRKQRRKKSRRDSSIRLKKKLKSSAERTIIYKPVDMEYEQKGQEGFSETEEKKDKKRLFFIGKNKKWVWSALFLVIVFGLVFFQKNDSWNENKQYITLKVPKETMSPLSKEQVNVLIKKGLLQYFRGTVPSYMKAQTLLAQAVEGDVKNTYGMAILCLVYLELWPFTNQDFNATDALSRLIHRTSVLNKGGVRSGLCHSVGLITKGKYTDAKTMVESSLDGLSGAIQDTESQKLFPVFYYLKALIFYYLNDYTAMISYLDTIRKILPNWVAPYMLVADALVKQNKLSEALSLYKKVTVLNPNHKAAKIKLGQLEYRHFNQPEKAQNLLQIALNKPGIVSDQILSEAFLILAEINLKNGATDIALKYAKQAYSYNPVNKASRMLVVQIGGVEKLKGTPVRSGQLVYEGDQLVLSGKFRSAIGYYEEAFEVDGEKNAVVALKVAKSYWALSFSDQAIGWLKKAININPMMMEAYALMAEYYADQYDFRNAEKTLQMASRKAPRSYELYRGKAYLALKKGDYKRVIQYAKTALSIYEADMESYVILSEAYRKLGDVNEALAFATRGLEVDPNAIKTQTAYAKALGSVYGVDTGVNYFQKLVENNPLIIEYRMALAKYLFEDERYSRAKSVLMDILGIESKYNEAYFYLGRILTFDGDFKRAYEAFLQSAIVNPSDPKPTFHIGLLRFKEKKYSKAKEQFKKVLALNKLYPKAHFYLGRIAFLQNDFDEAIEQARKESRSNPRLILPYLLAGEAYEKKKQFLNCSIEYQKAVELAPEDMSLYVKTARCYRKSGHLDLAVKILHKAGGENREPGGESTMELSSGDPQLYKELGVIYEMRGTYRNAAEAYCNYLNLMPMAPDRKDIKDRMKTLSKFIGKEIKNCG